MRIGWITVSYFLSSAGFSVVYLLSGSMIAAMISHSLQSMYAFVAVLLIGRGNYVLSPVIYLIAFSCPLWVYLIGKGLEKTVFRK